MRVLFNGWLVALCLVLMPPVFAAQQVRVGVYDFPPYAVKPESAQPAGLVPELLAALNKAQNQYRFGLVPTSVTRRYRDLQSSRFDMILFESPQWGWQDTEHVALDLHVEDAEVYVARAEPGRVARAVLVGAVPPILLKSEANPGGTPIEVLEVVGLEIGSFRSQLLMELAWCTLLGLNRAVA